MTDQAPPSRPRRTDGPASGIRIETEECDTATGMITRSASVWVADGDLERAYAVAERCVDRLVPRLRGGRPRRDAER